MSSYAKYAVCMMPVIGIIATILPYFERVRWAEMRRYYNIDSRGGRKSKSVRTVDKQFREASAVSTPSGGNPYTPST